MVWVVFLVALVVGLCWADNPNDGLVARVYPCDAGDGAQRWVAQGGRLHNGAQFPKEAKCLDIHKWSTADGAEVSEWHCTTSKDYNQLFTVKPDGTIRSGAQMGEKCLVSQGNVAGDRVVMWNCSTLPKGARSRWSPVGTSGFQLNGGSLCLSTASGGGPSGWPCQGPPGSQYPFCNASLSDDDRAKDLTSRLTTEEKISFLSNGLNGQIPAVPRLGVPGWAYHSEGLHGLRDTSQMGLYATLFPNVVGMTATGNVSLMRGMADVMGVEARACSNLREKEGKIFGKGCGLSYWSPTMNIVRDPRWGRGQESGSEDPYLNGVYSIQFVEGFQGEGRYRRVGATCKHLYAYSLEDSDGHTRHNFNAIVSQSDLQETYLPAFRACVEEAKPEEIMCSYNSVNGVPTCLHGDVQNGLARKQWGFDGFIVSDCDAIGDVVKGHKYASGPNATALGLEAGCDMDCGGTYAANAKAALSSGLLSNATLDQAVMRSVRLRFRLGEFDDPKVVPWRSITPNETDTPQHRALALQAGRESIVLLQNDKGVLPLTAAKGLKLGVVGPLGESTSIMMGAKNDYNPKHITTVVEGLSGRKGVTVQFEAGSTVTGTIKGGVAAAEKVARDSDVVVLVVGIDHTVEGEAHDRTAIGLPQPQVTLVQAVAAVGKPVVVVLMNGGALGVDWIRGHMDTVVEAFQPGQSGGVAVADVLFGDYNPSGVLPHTMYPADYVNQVKMDDMSMRAGPGRTYRFYTGTPLWSFGHGLSYTNFTLQWEAPVPNHVTTVEPLTVKVRVTNTGHKAGAKVVQAFAKAYHANAVPHGSMFGFQKVMLQPSESVVLTFTTPTRGWWCTFCTVDPLTGYRSVYPGQYDVFVGAGRQLTTTVLLTGDVTRVP